MIKLVTQFDNEKSKLSLATPTCGGSSCCSCCCIISTFAVANISARNFGDYAQKLIPNEPDRIKAARNLGFLYPIGAVVSLIIGFFISELFFQENLFEMILPLIIYLFLMPVSFIDKINLKGIIPRLIFVFIATAVIEIIGVGGG